MGYMREIDNCVPTAAPYNAKSQGITEEVDREIPQVVQRLEYGISELAESVDSIIARMLCVMACGPDVSKQSGTPTPAMNTELGSVLQEQVNRVNALNIHLRDVRNRLQV